MNIDFKNIFFSLALIFLAGCFEKGVESVEAETRKGLIVINVLDNKLYDDCHIKGSINVPFEKIEEKAKNFDKNAEIVLYCSNYMCTSSEYAAKKLKNLGFEQVSVYHGGTAEWYQEGLPIQGSCNSVYLTKKITGQQVQENEDDGQIPSVDVQTLAKKMGYIDTAA